MEARSRIDPLIRCLGIISSVACAAGAIGAMAVVLFRLPTVAHTKLELLFGTLQGVAVGLLFAIAALLINLTFMVRKTTRPQADPRGRALSQR
jgi:hypothetical protein